MFEKINKTADQPGVNYKCYGPGVTGTSEKTDFKSSQTGNDWRQEVYRVKEYGIPSTGFLHPPTVRPPPSFVEPLGVQIPNKFVNELYIKYPFLIPKCINPEEHHRVAQKSYTADFYDLTTYQEAYGNKGFPEPPELVEAKGLSLPEPDKPSIRLPGFPYMPLCGRPLPATDAVDLKRQREEKMASEKILQKLPPLPKRVSEYEDNINTLARYWKKNGLYTDPTFYIPYKPTLPNE